MQPLSLLPVPCPKLTNSCLHGFPRSVGLILLWILLFKNAFLGIPWRSSG